ncbi:F-box domain-containing protein [Mycena kentingensis (nom. inval.)]|nr:F-box domain-containing protein [Mycena kentingensis (nom. inval.)]
MADTALPDEILSEILSPALKVADDVFSDTSTAAFATYEESTSAYLLVNKAWLRVSTPLLYHTVVLRSKAQAIALANALTQNRDLGRFVKRLRVEGGFGPSMKTILALTPNVTDLFLSLDIYSNDSVVGLCGGMKLVSPSRLILTCNVYTQNKTVAALVNALVAAISEWDRLVSFESPYAYSFSTDQYCPSILKALATAKRLQHLTVPSARAAEWTYPLVKACPLRVVQSKDEEGKFNKLQSDVDATLKGLFRYQQVHPRLTAPSSEIVAPPLNPFFRPLDGAPPDVRAAILSRILYFAMDTPQRAYNAMVFDIDELQDSPHLQARLPFLLVSKEFLKCAVPVLYAHVVLDWEKIREFSSSSFQSRSRDVRSIIGFCGFSARVFAGLPRRYGSTLVDFAVSVYNDGTSLDADAFSDLSALKRLRWNSTAKVKLARPASGRSALPNIEELTLRAVDHSLLALLTEADLPRLRSLHILSTGNVPTPVHNSPFIQVVRAHVAKLVSLTITSDHLDVEFLELGTQLATLRVIPIHEENPPSIAALSPAHPALSLKMLVFTAPIKKGKRNPNCANWRAFFEQWDFKTSVPHLRDIQFRTLAWPTTERDIAKDPWVPIGELLLQDGIHLLDQDGKKWRPRLKVDGRR